VFPGHIRSSEGIEKLIFFLVFFLCVSVLCFFVGGVAGLVIGILAILLIGAVFAFFAYRHFKQTKQPKNLVQQDLVSALPPHKFFSSFSCSELTNLPLSECSRL